MPGPDVLEVEAYITIGLKDGRTLTKHVEHAIGSLERPMSDADLDSKFRGLTGGILSPAQTDKLIRTCRSLESLQDAGTIARASVPPRGRKDNSHR